MPADLRRALRRARRLVLVALALTLTVVLAVARAATSAAQSSPQPVPQPSSSPAISIPGGASVISLLDAVISWDRGRDLEAQIVEEPSEVLFFSQGGPRAAEILKLAFRYARAEAAALAGPRGAEGKAERAGVSGDILAHPEVIKSRRAAAEAEVASLQEKIQQLQKRVAASPRRKRGELARELSGAQGQLELARARAGFLATMSQFEFGAGQGPNP